MKENSTKFEELINAITTSFAIVLGIVGTSVLLLFSHNLPLIQKISFIVYGVSFVLTFVMATIYHAFFFSPHKKILRILDHCAIFLFIGGFYTPFIVYFLHGLEQIVALGVTWTLVILGMLFQVFKIKNTRISLLTYLFFSLLSFIEVRQIFLHFPLPGILLLFGGGFLFLIGAFFYIKKQWYMNHGIWHLFVFAGSACHLGALFYIR